MALVVSDHNHGRAGPGQPRQQVFAELPAEFRILLRGPFVRQKDRPLFQQTYDECRRLRWPPDRSSGVNSSFTMPVLRSGAK
jgi:hypothetical protein